MVDGELTLEDVVRLPQPGMPGHLSLRWSHDDALLTYLHDPDGGMTRSLYAWDGSHRLLAHPPGAGTTDDDLSLEERLRRERSRERGLGIASYVPATAADTIVVPVAGAAWVLDSGALRKIAEPPAVDPRPSPDGCLVAFVRDGDVWVVPASGGQARQVTRGDPVRRRGVAEFIAQEELGRSRGFWWSPDASRIAFCEVDESNVSVCRISGPDGSVEEHRYPFAGAENAHVRLGVASLAGGEPIWMDLDDEYLARVAWWPDGTLVAQTLDRAQGRLELARLDPDTGRRTTLLVEESDVWINLHDMLEPVDGGFVWASERTGWRHLSLHDRDGGLVGTLTSGDWLVTSVQRVTRDAVLFTGTRESPLERHLYRVPLSGGEPVRLTPEPGTHHCVVDHGGTRAADTWSSVDHPPRTVLRETSAGRELQTLFGSAEVALRAPRLVSIPSRDGVTLFGALHEPEGAGPHPVAVSVYGGPHAQSVANSWATTANMRAQYLRAKGVLVMALDNRGTANRGLRFEGAIRHDLASVEVRDQVDGIAWLVGQGLADPGRVAIYGWSYGGYMATLCLASAPDVYAAAVAGAPVTEWTGYDTAYTERYMGTPSSNPDGYDRSSVLNRIDGLRGRILLVHGMIDENVHFRHTARLVERMNRSRKPYELVLLPSERHGPRRHEDRLNVEERTIRFLEEALGPWNA